VSEYLKDKIWGSMAGLAVGDALGMPVHELTPAEIKQRYGGLVETFLPIWDDEFIHDDYKAGQVTDDTTLSLVTARAIIKLNGKITADQFSKELADWAQNNKAIWQHGKVYGPSTRNAFDQMINGRTDYFMHFKRTWCSEGTSNGSIMRIAPAGWVFPGDIEKTVELACNLILPTHPTEIALSAGSGQAAAVSEALTPDATVDSVIEAMLKGLKLGEEIGRKKARIVEQRNPLRNVEIALDLAKKSKDAFEAADAVRRVVGSHLHATEAIATAAAIFYASKGNTEQSILAAVNNGEDSDTNASIVGALTGALNGIGSVRREWVNKVEAVNSFNLEEIADQMVQLIRAQGA
jgi:ADP-ribosylglycohydrolase